MQQNPEALLKSIDQLLASMPAAASWSAAFGSDVISDGEAIWLAEVAAVIKRWDQFRATTIDHFVHGYRTASRGIGRNQVRQSIFMLLREARADIVIRTPQPIAHYFGPNTQLDFFCAVRDAIAAAQGEVFFVDPFFRSESVDKFLVLVAASCRIRVLSLHRRDIAPALKATLQAFTAQTGHSVEWRTDKHDPVRLHGRFLLIDQLQVYEAGHSFSEVGNKAATFTPRMVDSARIMQDIESIWAECASA